MRYQISRKLFIPYEEESEEKYAFDEGMRELLQETYSQIEISKALNSRIVKRLGHPPVGQVNSAYFLLNLNGDNFGK